MNTDEQAVAAVLKTYQDALNASNTETVMPLYTEDGVFMPPFSPSAIGQAALRAAYDAVFAAITLSVTFHIAEIVEIGPAWAFARTNSMGTTTDHATGHQSTEANQELFLFQKDDGGDWKIARYSFSSTNPPQAS